MTKLEELYAFIDKQKLSNGNDYYVFFQLFAFVSDEKFVSLQA